jgi:glycosyltransferase involved in cell wall biosynthesis
MRTDALSAAMPDPLLTVITVAYNAEASIEQTISSVAAQSAPGIEYLVIDGASADGTVEILRRNARHISHWSRSRTRASTTR